MTEWFVVSETFSFWSLFLSAFLSSTLLPGSSEALLVAYLSQEFDPRMLLLVATAGNTLGGVSSWLLGYWLAIRLPAQGLVKPGHQRALVWIQRWGSGVLLLSWLPLIGDPLCVVAGWLRMHWFICVLMILLGKAARYGVLLYIAG